MLNERNHGLNEQDLLKVTKVQFLHAYSLCKNESWRIYLNMFVGCSQDLLAKNIILSLFYRRDQPLDGSVSFASLSGVYTKHIH